MAYGRNTSLEETASGDPGWLWFGIGVLTGYGVFIFSLAAILSYMMRDIPWLESPAGDEQQSSESDGEGEDGE